MFFCSGWYTTNWRASCRHPNSSNFSKVPTCPFDIYILELSLGRIMNTDIGLWPLIVCMIGFFLDLSTMDPMSILCLLTLTILISWAEATSPWSIRYESKILRFSVTQLSLLMCVCKAFYFESADAWSLQLQEISGLVIKDRLMSTLIHSSCTSDWRI